MSRAHVSRRTFYAHFETKEDCVLATFGAASRCIADAVREAYVAADEWDAAMAAALVELMRVLAEYPHTARTCFLEIRSVGPAAAEPMTATRLTSTEACAWRSPTARVPPVEDMAFEMGIGGCSRSSAPASWPASHGHSSASCPRSPGRWWRRWRAPRRPPPSSPGSARSGRAAGHAI